MPRPARFDQDAILNAALRVVTTGGPSTMTTEAVADEMGGHVGSIYYRFPTKDHLLAQLWMRCSRSGHVGLLQALAREDLDEALVGAVLHYPRWSRRDLASAQILAAYGREQLIPRWPDDLAAALETVNDNTIRAIGEFTRRYFDQVTPTRRRVMTFVVLDMPASAIRRYLPAGRPPPDTLDDPILAAARAALAAV